MCSILIVSLSAGSVMPSAGEACRLPWPMIEISACEAEDLHMTHADMDGSASFIDRETGGEVNTHLRLRLDLDLGRVYVGEGDAVDEIVFAHRAARQSLRDVILALRRREYRRQPIRAVPKPRSGPCKVCGDRRYYVNPYSGEVYRCPACR